MPTGGQCISQRRICNDGILSGSYEEKLCSVEDIQLPPYTTNICTITATPSTIRLGQSTTLSWTAVSSGAIVGVGGVSKSGSVTVTPTKTRNYSFYQVYDGVLPPDCSVKVVVDSSYVTPSV